MEDSKGKIGVNLGGLDESVIFFFFFDKINFSVKASCTCRCEVLDVFCFWHSMLLSQHREVCNWSLNLDILVHLQLQFNTSVA